MVPWSGTLVKEGEWTGDDRLFEPGSLEWGVLPIPLRWAPEDFGGHDGAQHVGWITSIVRADGNEINASGTIFDPTCQAYLEQCREAGAQAGVSVDVDSDESTIEIPPDALPDGEPPVPGTEYPVLNEMTRFQAGRIRAATIVDIPAFIDAGLTLTASVAPEPTHAGLAVQAADTGRVLMLQRAMPTTCPQCGEHITWDSSDGPQHDDGSISHDDGSSVSDAVDDPAAGKWEFPGGGIEPGETPMAAAAREFQEETGLPVPPGQVTNTWTSTNGVYALHVYSTPNEMADCNPPTDDHVVPNPDGDSFETAAWFTPEDLADMPSLRDEAKATPWEMFDMTMPDAPAIDPTAPDAPALTPEQTKALNTLMDALKAADTAGDDPAIMDLLDSQTDVDDNIDCAMGDVAGLLGVDPPVDADAPDDMDTLIASAAPVAPPADWFEPFELDGPTPLTITADGRVFGHLADWNSCHASGEYSGQCVRPPSDPEARYFHLGQVLTAEGSLVAAGVVTVGGGHAARNKKIQAAIEHYDNASTAVAVVRAHEDKYGIGIFGSVTPGATDTQIATLRRHPLSGDWRKEGGKWRLIAAHAVNTPGYPVLRGQALVASIGPESFIVEGRVERDPAGVDFRSAADYIAKSIGMDHESLVASYRRSFEGVIVASVGGDTSLPIAPYDTAWDASKAADDILGKYTDGTGHVDEQSVEKAFLYIDGDPQLKGSYHLPIADFVNGELQIIPNAVQAAAGGEGVGAVAGISGPDKADVSTKICTLYSAIQAKFPEAPDCPLT